MSFVKPLYKLLVAVVLTLLPMTMYAQWKLLEGGVDGCSLTYQKFFRYGNLLFVVTRGGLYKSTDEGKNWVYSSQGFPCFFNAKLRSSNSALFALTDGNLYASTDSGSTWTALAAGNEVKASDVEIVNDTIYLVRLFDPKAGGYSSLYRSTDQGNNFSFFDTLQSVTYTGAGILYNLLNRLFVNTSHSNLSDTQYLLVATHERLHSFPTAGLPAGGNLIDLADDTKSIFILSGKNSRVYKYNLSLSTWIVSSNGFPEMTVVYERYYGSLLSIDSVLYCSVSGYFKDSTAKMGIYESRDGGESWSYFSTDIYDDYFDIKFSGIGYLISYPGAYPKHIYFKPDTSSGYLQSYIKGIRAGENDKMLSTKEKLVVLSEDIGIFLSEDKGKTFNIANQGLPALNKTSRFSGDLAKNKEFIYLVGGYTDIYYLKDIGSLWTKMQLPPNAKNFRDFWTGGKAVLLRIVWESGQAVDKYYRTFDNGSTWGEITTNIKKNLSSTSQVQLIAGSNTLYLLGTKAGTDSLQLFQSSDFGEEFTAVKANLPAGLLADSMSLRNGFVLDSSLCLLTHYYKEYGDRICLFELRQDSWKKLFSIKRVTQEDTAVTGLVAEHNNTVYALLNEKLYYSTNRRDWQEYDMEGVYECASPSGMAFIGDSLFITTPYQGQWKNKAFTGTPLAVEDYISDQTISIYQTTGEDELHVRVNNPQGKRLNLYLYDLMGKEVALSETSASSEETLWRPDRKLTGMFICKAESGTQSQTKKVIFY